jgi:hypothetical protein
MTLHLSVLCGSQSIHNIKRLVFKADVESVYSAVRNKSLHKTDTLRLYGVKEETAHRWHCRITTNNAVHSAVLSLGLTRDCVPWSGRHQFLHSDG